MQQKYTQLMTILQIYHEYTLQISALSIGPAELSIVVITIDMWYGFFQSIIDVKFLSTRPDSSV